MIIYRFVEVVVRDVVHIRHGHQAQPQLVSLPGTNLR